MKNKKAIVQGLVGIIVIIVVVIIILLAFPAKIRSAAIDATKMSLSWIGISLDKCEPRDISKIDLIKSPVDGWEYDADELVSFEVNARKGCPLKDVKWTLTRTDGSTSFFNPFVGTGGQNPECHEKQESCSAGLNTGKYAISLIVDYDYKADDEEEKTEDSAKSRTKEVVFEVKKGIADTSGELPKAEFVGKAGEQKSLIFQPSDPLLQGYALKFEGFEAITAKPLFSIIKDNNVLYRVVFISNREYIYSLITYLPMIELTPEVLPQFDEATGKATPEEAKIKVIIKTHFVKTSTLSENSGQENIYGWVKAEYNGGSLFIYDKNNNGLCKIEIDDAEDMESLKGKDQPCRGDLPGVLTVRVLRYSTRALLKGDETITFRVMYDIE